MTEGVKVIVLGTCSGTEPMPNRHHAALAIQHAGKLFWFDAGESCSYNAYLAGLDLPTTEAIFISHTDMDHIDGLPNLLWTLRKLSTSSSCPVHADARRKLEGRTIDLFIPDLEAYEGIRKMLSRTEGGFVTPFAIEAKRVHDGVLFDQHGVRVIALHNGHRGSAEPFLSYSFRIEAGGKSIVYSGDVKSTCELEPLIDSCDLLLMETGHHDVEEVCRYLHASGKSFGTLVFVHHGRAILKDPAGELRKAQAILGNRVRIADDGQVFDL